MAYRGLRSPSPVADEPESLELELSLGRWQWAQTSGGRPRLEEGNGPQRSPEWNIPLNLSFGSSSSSCFLEASSSEQAPAAFREEEGGEEDDDEGADRDLQNKRVKVVDFNDIASCTGSFCFAAASMSMNEMMMPTAALEHAVAQTSATRLENSLDISLCMSITNEGDTNTGASNNDGNNIGLNLNPENPKDVASDMNSSTPHENCESTGVRMDLSDDLVHLVFSFLAQKDLCKASATCKQWRAASMHEDFWRCLNFENTGISHQNFQAMCSRYRNATEVNLSGVPSADEIIIDAIGHLRNLHTLTLGKGHVGESFFHEISGLPSLTSLSIYESNLGLNSQEMTLHHDRLVNLQVVKCRVSRVTIRCPQLQTLSLKRSNMGHAFITCPMLRELDVSACHKLSDAGIRIAAQTCPLLSVLDMSSCSCTSDDMLREIANCCPNITYLDASSCPNVSLESVRLPMLTELKLESCEGITSTSMASISSSHLLEALQLDNCSLLTSVSLDLPHLKKLSLVHCRKFVELNLRCSVLSYLKVSNCSALRRVSIMSNALQKLVLHKQESLADLSLQCCQMQEVDLSDCESLSNSICEVFSDGGGCPMLKSLILDNCEGLTSLKLNSGSMIGLSLVGCRGMHCLELSCPNLKTVNLDGCDHLETASFCPVGLWSLNLGMCPKLRSLLIEAPYISILELKGCGMLSEASINCPRLLSLDASFCRQLMDDSLSAIAASCPQIECLVLSSCLSVGPEGLASLHQLRYLTLLDLSYTFLIDLKPILETCPQLEILKLSACKYLTESSLDALSKDSALPALRELDLSYSSIGQSAILEILSSCTSLFNLNLNGCANMSDLIWTPSKSNTSLMPPMACSSSKDEPECLLETLNCTGCPNIKKVLISSASRGFPLCKLNLNLSTNLKEVTLTCANLNSLNLSNCISLEMLKLDCPRLTNLQLLACTMLDEECLAAAISRCPMLETLNILSCPKISSSYLGQIKRVCPSLKRMQSSIWM